MINSKIKVFDNSPRISPIGEMRRGKKTESFYGASEKPIYSPVWFFEKCHGSDCIYISGQHDIPGGAT